MGSSRWSLSSEFEDARRELGLQLRRLRRSRGLTHNDLAERAGAGFSQPKISKIETGRVLASPADVERILDVLDVDEKEAHALIDLAETLAEESSTWRLIHRRGLRGKQEQVLAEELASATVRFYQPTLIPGPLQLPEYARAVLEMADVSGRNDVMEAVAVRVLERQRLVLEGSRRYDFLVEEDVLYKRYCPPDVMTLQLEWMQSIGLLPHIRLAVIPRDAKRTVLTYQGFVIYDKRLVVVEGNVLESKFARASQVKEFNETYEALLTLAADEGGTQQVIRRATTHLQMQEA